MSSSADEPQKNRKSACAGPGDLVAVAGDTYGGARMGFSLRLTVLRQEIKNLWTILG